LREEEELVVVEAEEDSVEAIAVAAADVVVSRNSFGRYRDLRY
jgi:glutamine amidotransferase PdxT